MRTTTSFKTFNAACSLPRWPTRVGIPCYLLVDQDPRAAQSTLFSNPDPNAGEYKHQTSWDFGQTIRLPHPLDFEIQTADWEP